MTIRDYLVALRRQPVVALVGAALTLLLLVRAEIAPPDYQARAVVTLLSPQVPFPRNNYASFSPDLVIAAEVSARSLSSAAGQRRVRQAGGTAGFEVARANRGNQELPIYDQPYLTFTTNSGDSGRAKRTLLAALAVFRSDLRQRQVQEGAKPGSLIGWRITAITNRPIPQTGQPSRELLAIGLLGSIGTVFAAILAERHRRRLGRLGRLNIVRTSSRPSRPTKAKLVVK